MRVLSLFLTALLMGQSAVAAPSLVVLVRHAEKASGADPGLTAAGKRRAEALAEALAHAGIRYILSSDAQRTRATAAPLAERLGLQVEAVGFGPGGLAAHRQQLLARVQALEGGVLVVGHSNTVTELAAALGVPKPLPPCETRFGLAWVVLPQTETPPRLLSLRYGEPDPIHEPNAIGEPNVDKTCQ
ncbi:phosphohistidine phosphatase SixA [Inhella inkyongensis]|uniref:Phosphohistidine phosphatase SixA n=1 Tax=Inhella inkyongensis TaxID=392593 RepID=A0A840S719_9BURK|nr:histidine phosphatase family protein [Inhella inkyongensis]MBB5205483.1 phosphohistidine phosphatase SixA [Inhella inkyongensis]